MRCYICNRTVMTPEHVAVKRLFDHAEHSSDQYVIAGPEKGEEDLLTLLTEELGLIHCSGEKDEFDEDGAVVVCKSHVLLKLIELEVRTWTVEKECSDLYMTAILDWQTIAGD